MLNNKNKEVKPTVLENRNSVYDGCRKMKISDQYVVREVLGENIIVPTGQAALTYQGIIAVNETGAFLVRYLQEHDADQTELVQAVCGEYDIDEDTAKKDVEGFLKTIWSRRILAEAMESQDGAEK